MQQTIARATIGLTFICAFLLGITCDAGSSGGSDDDDDSSSGGGSDAGSGGATDAGSDGGNGGTGSGSGGDAVEPSFGSGSHFDSVMAMFDYVNGQRTSYQPHDRYKGFPFGGGSYHTNVTWPITFTWSAAAAATAQAEANAVAAGGTPSGSETDSNPGANHLFIAGLNTADYMVTAQESAGAFSTDQCTLCNSNPFMRMAVFYHDPGGDGPVLTELGIGAAAVGADTWWVLKFE